MISPSRVATIRNGWKICTDPENVGREEGWFNDYAREGAADTPVPGIIQQVFPEYHGVVWYWTKFSPSVSPKPSEHVFLHFGAVDYYAEVWLNGVYVGSHEGGETPFDLEVTSMLEAEAETLLAVRVINPSHEPIDGFVLGQIPHTCKVVPYRVGATQNHGGIVLPVEIRVLPAVRIQDAFVRPDPQSGTVRIEAVLQNGAARATGCTLVATIGAPTSTGATATESAVSTSVSLEPGRTVTEVELRVVSPRLWSPEDPHLYNVDLRVEAILDGGENVEHSYGVRCGFRDLHVGEDGYFRLNGRRIFLRSSHTVNNFPIGLRLVSHDADILRRDLLYAKAAGFNMIRFIAGMAHPEQLSFCDEIGLMVYQETYAGWRLEDSPQMAERFDRSISEMILRDRNHASVIIWGLLNETPDNPVSRHAMSMLPLIRSLDDTRLVLLSSGRWDNKLNVGSVSNPGTSDWQCVWGSEVPTEAVPEPKPRGYYDGIGDAVYYHGVGDTHMYPRVPHDADTIRFLRTLGSDAKPVFLSEYGVGSLVNAIRVTRLYEQVDAGPDLEDAALYRRMAERFVADWHAFGMDEVYPFPEDMLQESQRLHSRQRLVGLDAIRSNPNINGYNLTGTVDQVMGGEGLWTTWRELKPGTMDALVDGLAPLRWCLFVEPLHGYVGRPFKVEAVLANEDVLKPGEYPVRLRIFGPTGVVWERSVELTVPESRAGEEPPLALPVLSEEVTIGANAGTYCFAATMERGGAPAGGRLRFRVADADAPPRLGATVTLLGVEKEVESFLRARGVRCRPYGEEVREAPEVIIVGNPGRSSRRPAFGLADWRELVRRISTGAVAVFLDPRAFERDDDAVGWLPLANKGRCNEFFNWVYHREDVAKKHPLFDGLQAGGILDWDYYQQVIPHYLFEGQDVPEEVVAAAFAVGYAGVPVRYTDGYTSGMLASVHKLGSGRFMLNTFRILENLDTSPVADRLLLNAIGWAASCAPGLSAGPPEHFPALLESIGYSEG